MKGFRFYAVMPDERKSKSASKRYPHAPWTRAYLKACAERGEYVECVGVAIDASWVSDGAVLYECAGALMKDNDQAVCGSSCSTAFLRERCTSIDEATARKLHPALFRYLESIA